MLLANEAVADAADEPAPAGGVSRPRGARRAAAAGVSRGGAEPQRAVRQPPPAGRKCRSCCTSSAPCPSARRSRSAFSNRSCAPATPSNRSATTVWPRRNTRTSPRPSAATPTSWCIAPCSTESHGSTPALKANRRAHLRHGTQLRRRRARQQGREAVRVPQGAARSPASRSRIRRW